jgi:hypothetical protein
VPITHELKTLAVYFDAIARGEKNFEVRRDDRGFQKGDTLRLLRLYDNGSYKDRAVEYKAGKPAHVLTRKISFILTGGQFGIEPGFVVLALAE